MTADILQIIDEVECLGWHVLGYHDGRFYIAGLRWRNYDWCFRTIQFHITPRGRVAS